MSSSSERLESARLAVEPAEGAYAHPSPVQKRVVEEVEPAPVDAFATVKARRHRLVVRQHRHADQRRQPHGGAAPGLRARGADPHRRRRAAAADRRRAPATHPGHRGRRAGPRPAAAPAARPDGHRDHGQRAREDLRRARWPTDRERSAIRLRATSAAGHRTHRRQRGPPDRRVVAPGRRATVRRFTRQRRHPTLGGARIVADDPQVLRDAAPGRRPRPVQVDDTTDGGAAERVRPGPPQHHRLGRHGHRQDDAAERPVVVHPDRTSGS